MDNDEHEIRPGQRWLSDAESDLGLGTVLRVDPRQIRLVFPAAGITRTYARGGSPLTRVRFGPGDSVRDRDGNAATVIAVESMDGLLVYQGETPDGRRLTIPEQALDDHLRLNRPREKLLAARVDRDTWFSLRLDAWERMAAQARSPVFGLVGPRVARVPHQLYIAAEVASRHAPRVLLADEVGLGKTIEAGLITHRLLLTGAVRRVLVLVPESLLHQWLVELLRRFNLRFALFDRERVAEEGADAFAAEQQVLCSLELLLADAAAREAVERAGWDLLIVDEAHHLAWSPGHSSPAYDLARDLAAATPAVLLLTATPEQLGRTGHFARLRLLDPNRYADYDAFVAQEQAFAPIAELGRRLDEGLPLDPHQRELLGKLLDRADDLTPREALDRLIDLHGTGRVLFRNTRAAVSGFPDRRLTIHPLDCPAAYREGRTSTTDDLTPELRHGSGWTEIDPRAGWLAQRLRELRPAKVLVICAHADTALALREFLLSRAGIHTAVFHEGMAIVERDRAAAYFADPDEGTQALICSEIGSEGRNFQFAHHLVLFDLPADPDLLEQRIGRLDRIGQRETVQLHVPVLRGSAGEVALRWLDEGLGAFAAPCPAGSAVYRALGEDLHAAIGAAHLSSELLERTRELRRRLNRELEAGRDRLLELHSHRPEVSADLVERIAVQDADRALADYMTRYWELFGVEHEPGGGNAVVLRPGAHMLHERFPALPEDGTTATFKREDALAHEERDFLTWEHPMVLGALEHLTGTDLGAAAITAVRDADFKPGSLLLEAVYVIECAAPPGLQLERFLPATALRLLLDPAGNELAAQYPHERLQGTCLTRNRKLVKAVLTSQAPRIRALLEAADGIAEARAHPVVASATDRMRETVGAEQARLEQLARSGGGVRPDELAHVRELPDLLARHLAKAGVRLDSVRVVVTH